METPEHNKLNDLLKKSGSGSLDDFEREALDGFETLASHQEAQDLQQRVDKKAEELFSEKKKQRITGWWYAAAGILLVVGFSVFFMQNQKSFENKANVAAAEQPKSESSNMPAPAEMAKVKTSDELKPDQKALPEKEANLKLQTEAKNEIKTIEPLKKDLENGAYTVKLEDANKASGQGAEEKKVFSGAGGKAEKEEEIVDRKDATVTKNAEPAFSIAERNQMNGPDANKTAQKQTAVENKKQMDDGYRDGDADLAKKTDKDYTDALSNNEAGAKKPETASNTKNNGINQDLRARKKGKEASPGRAEGKSGENTDIANKSDIVSAKDQAVPAEEQKEKTESADEKTKEKLARENDKKTNLGIPNNTNAANGGSFAQNNHSNGTVANQQPINATNGAVVYEWTAPDVELQKEVTNKLKAIGLNKKFDAVLTISKNNKVEKVKFDNTYGLSKGDQDKIEGALKTITKFSTSGKKESWTYILLHRP